MARTRGWPAVIAGLAFGLQVSAGPAAELARDVLQGPVAVDVIRVIDGDTIVVRAHPWLGVFIETSVRLAGIDAPELHGRCDGEIALAARARDRLAELLAGGAARLDDIRHDKYGGRVRARVLDSAGLDVGAALIAAGLARPYHGERRAPWCSDPG
ncbi:MAG: thermonuclease family protein [Rhodospirillaceae bacterium]